MNQWLKIDHMVVVDLLNMINGLDLKNGTHKVGYTTKTSISKSLLEQCSSSSEFNFCTLDDQWFRSSLQFYDDP